MRHCRRWQYLHHISDVSLMVLEIPNLFPTWLTHCRRKASQTINYPPLLRRDTVDVGNSGPFFDALVTTSEEDQTVHLIVHHLSTQHGVLGNRLLLSEVSSIASEEGQENFDDHVHASEEGPSPDVVQVASGNSVVYRRYVFRRFFCVGKPPISYSDKWKYKEEVIIRRN